MVPFQYNSWKSSTSSIGDRSWTSSSSNTASLKGKLTPWFISNLFLILFCVFLGRVPDSKGGRLGNLQLNDFRQQSSSVILGWTGCHSTLLPPFELQRHASRSSCAWWHQQCSQISRRWLGSGHWNDRRVWWLGQDREPTKPRKCWDLQTCVRNYWTILLWWGKNFLL